MSAFDPTTPPEGWTAIYGLLQPTTTIAGYAARGDEVKGRCHQRDCRRTCHIDMPRLVESGFGRVPIEAVKRLLRCSRIDGCAMDWFEERPIGFRLDWLLGRPHVAIRFMCVGCKFHRTALPDRVVAKLQAKGPSASNDATVEKLAKMPMEACKNCGKNNWRVDVLWPDVNIGIPGRSGARGAWGITMQSCSRLPKASACMFSAYATGLANLARSCA
jgi:hypothetical protein